MFIVDCGNYSANKQLDWRTPIEKLQGFTPDISVFRFSFWRPLWYYEPTAKFPALNFLPGRMVGIAWEHGDALSYRIWTTPNDDWEQGTELIRNVVQDRHYTDNEPRASYDDSSLVFQGPKKKTQKKEKARYDDKKRSQPIEKPDDGVASPREKKIRFSEDPQILSQTDSEELGGEEEMQDKTNNNSNQIKAADSTSNRKRIAEGDVADVLDYDPLDDLKDYEMTEEINNELSDDKQFDSTVGGARVVEITTHDWKDGHLKLKVMWNTENRHGKHSGT
jgi:hypothetical protein